ncbi:MAG: S8 family serine peptidase, partial [Pseudomonadota bacterium]
QTANGSSETFEGTREAVRLAMEAGVVIVSAAGNAGVELVEEALDDTGSVIVGALAQDESQIYFSNYGDRITVGAFGENLLTLEGPDGRLGSFGGTSGATPQVAAAVAMMLEVNPALTPLQVKDILESTSLQTEENRNVGGMVNIVEAIKVASETEGEKGIEAQIFRQRVAEILTSK